MYTLDKEINALCKQRNELLTLDKLVYDHPALQYAKIRLVYDEEQQKFDEKLKRNPNYRLSYVNKWN